MPINTKTATAAIALLIGAGAFPLAATAQTETEGQEVEVEVIEAEEAEQAAEQTGETVEQAAEDTGEAIEQTAEEAGEAVEIDTSQAEDLDESQKQELEQAAAEGKPVPRPEMIMGVQKEGQWLSSELIGRSVTNQNGETIGDIGAILFSDQGPDGVIVEVGGFLGLGEKDVAIRWDELNVTEEGIMVDASEEALENAPEFMTAEEQRERAELQAQQEAAEAEQATQQTEGLPPADEAEQGMSPEPIEGGEVEAEGETELEVETEQQ